MLSTFIIALREGLEAALIIGILVAYILKTDRRHLLAPLWSGVAAAIVGSIGLGLILSKTSEELTERAEKLFVGTTSFLAVALVTWMVFWMKRTARTLKADLHGKVDSALRTGPLALAGAAFFAVIREGLETALFVYTNFKTIADTRSAALGLILGFAAAISLGYLIFKSAIKLDLSKFFRYTGVALVVVAAGVLSYGVHEFQELGWLPGGESYAWDVSNLIPKDSLLGATLGGLVGFDNTTSWLQLGIWTIYVTSVLGAYLSKPRTRALTPA
jgi:high-affinity iron transporter